LYTEVTRSYKTVDETKKEVDSIRTRIEKLGGTIPESAQKVIKENIGKQQHFFLEKEGEHKLPFLHCQSFIISNTNPNTCTTNLSRAMVTSITTNTM
jgi:hypothetical protein